MFGQILEVQNRTAKNDNPFFACRVELVDPIVSANFFGGTPAVGDVVLLKTGKYGFTIESIVPAGKRTPPPVKKAKR